MFKIVFILISYLILTDCSSDMKTKTVDEEKFVINFVNKNIRFSEKNYWKKRKKWKNRYQTIEERKKWRTWKKDFFNSLWIQEIFEFGEIYTDIMEPIKSQSKLGVLSDIILKDLSPPLEKNKETILKTFTWLHSINGQNFTLSEYFRQFKKISSINIDIIHVSIDPKSRKKEDLSVFTQAIVRARFDIRGEGTKNVRQDIFIADFIAKKSLGKWSSFNAKVLSGETRLQNRKITKSFKNITREVGLFDIPIQLRTEAIRRGGYALSVTDYNADQNPDLFIGLREGGQAYQLKEKKYYPIDISMNKENYIKTALFADFDKDGDQDSIIVRFTPHKSKKPREHSVDVVYYSNQGNGQFSQIDNIFGEPDYNREPMPATVGDFNGDDYFDFYVGYPGQRDFTAFTPDPESVKKTQGLYINNKQGGFIEQTKKRFNFFDSMSANKSNLYPHSAVAVDYDLDRDIDIIVADDRGNISPLYQNSGKGLFVDISKRIGFMNEKFAMTFAIGDYNNDGITDIAITNVLTSAQEAYYNSRLINYSAMEVTPKDYGLRLFSGTPSGQFVEVTESSNLSFPGNGTAGVIFIDYDNDGYQDLYVTNGLWSGTPHGQDVSFFYTILLNKSSFGGGIHSSLSKRDFHGLLPLLSNIRGRRFDYNSKTWLHNNKKQMRPSLAGFERNRLYRNNGDGTFTDIAFFEGVDLIADGYIVGKLDYNRDGKMDLILRNADPGIEEYKYPAVTLFENNIDNGNNSVTVALKSQGADSVGSFAIAEIEGMGKSVHHLIGNNGSMQSERVLHIGLGKKKVLNKLVIYWHNGDKQVIYNLSPGFHLFERPSAKLYQSGLRIEGITR